jgi:hypothetical protein
VIRVIRGSKNLCFSCNDSIGQVLTDKTPYSKIREVFAKQGLPQKPTDLNPALPKDADELILAMCAYDPAKRLADLDQVIVFLELLK